MSKLKTDEREDTPESKFALSEEREYLIEGKAHAQRQGPRRPAGEGREPVRGQQEENRRNCGPRP